MESRILVIAFVVLAALLLVNQAQQPHICEFRTAQVVGTSELRVSLFIIVCVYIIVHVYVTQRGSEEMKTSQNKF